MSSIDERIVSIKFNNAQFEAGIKTTMTSLDGLKKTLNFSAGISALGDLDAAGKKVTGPKLDTTGFQTSVQTTIDASNKLKSNLKFDGVTQGLSDLDAAGKKVHLKIDPTSFQSGAKAVVDAASTIKQNLNFESVQRGIGNLKTSVSNFSFQSIITGSQNAMKSLADLDLAGKAVSFVPISDGAARAQQSISAMSVAGIAALGALVFKAASAGLEMGKSLFIDPAKSGLAEYEMNLGSIQTIMSNTQWENKSLGDVNGALEELNTYSDKTIYNFAQMADSIGRFTSAGVSLDDSTAAIKGISNLAAISGSNSGQAATAMQQLSQAMSAGKVGLEDWNSVVSAGMGGKVFQDALIETARNQGSNVDSLIAKHGSFRQSLQDGWITTKVMNETLSKMTGDLTDEQLRSMGYNDEQIVGIQKMAATALDAATKIKTFSQLTGTLSEITGSGWAKSWQLILGDFEQAKEMWTSVYKVLGDMLQGTADARNKMLGDWNQAGGRADMIGAVSAAFKVLMGILTPIKEAFREVFPPMTGQKLAEITKAIRVFIEALIPGEQATSLLKNTFKLLFTIIKLGVDIIKGALGVVFAFFKAFATGGDSISGSMKPITDMLETLRFNIANSAFVQDFFIGLNKAATFMGEALRKVIDTVVNFIVPLVQLGIHMVGLITWSTLFAHYFGIVGDVLDIAGRAVIGFLKYLGNLSVAFRDAVQALIHGGMDAAIKSFKDSLEVMGNVGDAVFTRITERVESIKRFADRLASAWDQVMAAMGRAWEKMLPFREAVATLFGDLGEEMKKVFTDVNFDDTLDMVNTGLLAGLVLLFKGFFKKLTGMGSGVKDGLMENISSSFEGINGVLEQLAGTLGAMQQNLQADTLMKIAIAIGVMAISVIALSFIDSGKLTKALIAIGVMVVILGKAMEMLDKISVGSGFLKIPFIAASMILLAIALTILTIPVLILSRLSWMELLKGLAGVGILLLFISKATESMAKNPANLIATGIGLMAVAVAIKILASAVADISKLSFGEMVQGLIGVGVLLTALSIFTNMTKVNKGAVASAFGLILLATALKIMASALGDFAAMDVGNMIQGLATMGIVLLLLSKFNSAVNPEGVFKTAAAMVVLGIALKIMASALMDFASMSWEELAKGLITMVIALDAMSKAMARVPPNMLLSAIGFVAVAVALKILASALKDMGGMSWEEIGKGMVVLAGSMLILSVGLAAMSGSLAGAAALFVVAAGLAILAPVLVQLGNLSWEQIGMGMAALAAVFLIFGLAGLILAPIVPVIFSLGVAIGMLGLGLMAIGVGVLAFSMGLALISSVVVATGPLLVAFVMTILALIPMAMTELAKGIVAFAGVIGNAMPIFLQAFVALLTTLISAVTIVFPQIMALLWLLLVELVALVVRAIPLLVDAGYKLIIGILEGIGNNIGNLVDAGSRVITEFLDGIARNLPSIIESGVNLIISFIEGLAKSVRENSERMSNAGLDLAQAIIDGIVNGIGAGVGRVVKAAQDMVGNLWNAAMEGLDAHSPSRKFVKLGKWSDEGLAIGLTKHSGLVAKAATSVGLLALDTLKESLSDVGSTISGEFDMQPVIRPVLDLSAVKRDSGLISKILPESTLSVEGSYSKAISISDSDRANREAALADNTNTEPVEPRTVKLEQYNYSPKALSDIEIYRQTKNLLSTAKGV